MKDLLDFIAGPESAGRYDVAYGGTRLPPGLTLGEAIEWAKRHGKATGSSAVGRYQFLARTLEDVAKDINPSTPFTPELQDMLATRLLERRGLSKYQAGELSPEAFAHNLSKEWAGLPAGPHGRSYYAGDAMGNRAGVGWDETLAALRGAQQPGAPEGQQPGQASMNDSQMMAMGMPPMQRPQATTWDRVMNNPLLAMGLGILGTPAPNPLMGIARGAQAGMARVSQAQQAQMKLDLAMREAYDKLQERQYQQEERERKRGLQQQLQMAADAAGLDPLERALILSNPQAGVDLLAQQRAQRAIGAMTDLYDSQGSGGAPGGAPPQGGAQTYPLQPQEPTVAPGGPQGPSMAPPGGGVNPFDAMRQEGIKKLQLAEQVNSPELAQQGMAQIVEADKLAAQQQADIESERRKYQSPEQVRAAANDVEKFLGPHKTALMEVEQVKALLEQNNAMAATAAIQTFQRILDPGAVVRESDIAMIKQAQPLIGYLDSLVIQAKKGEALTPAQKDQMREVVDELANINVRLAESKREALMARYGPYYPSQSIGLNWTPEVPEPPPPPPGGLTPEERAEMEERNRRFRGER